MNRPWEQRSAIFSELGDWKNPKREATNNVSRAVSRSGPSSREATPALTLVVSQEREDQAASRQLEREELIQAGAGDESAVRRLYRTHVDRVFRLVARIIGSHDPDIEDVVQNVFLAVLDGAHAFDGRSKLSTWIAGIAIRRALDHSRSKWRRKRWHDSLRIFGAEKVGESPESQHIARSESERLLMKLEPQLRTVFVLADVEEYTLQEISEMTGTGISTLHARLKSAREKLERGEP